MTQYSNRRGGQTHKQIQTGNITKKKGSNKVLY